MTCLGAQHTDLRALVQCWWVDEWRAHCLPGSPPTCLARPSRSHHPQVELLSPSAIPTEKPQTTLHGGQTVAPSDVPLVSSAVVCAFWNLGAGAFLQLRPPRPHQHTHICPSAGAFFLCKQSPCPLLCLTVFSLCIPSHLGSGRVIVSATSARHRLGGGICEDWDSQ